MTAPARPASPSPNLPILARRDEIIRAVRAHQVVVVCGETGSGKTTQLPQMVLDAGLSQGGMIAHTQPRRLAARAVAARIAEERGSRLGGEVGVKVRFQDTTSRDTRIKLLTDGMLLAELGGDALLRAYSVIIIDEAHERSLNIDFLMGYLRQLLARRPDLRVVITSATIDPKRFAEYFARPGADVPVIEVSGRGYPVDITYRPHRDDEDEPERVEVEHVADAVEELCSHAPPPGTPGHILVFLPGEREIRMAGNALAQRRLDAEVLPLFSRLTNQEQDRIFHPGGRRRVILSTNVAETSLTVPGIVYVVDTGMVRLSRYDPARKIQRLPIEGISRASANQRAGRCGRIAPGTCVRLYSEASYSGRPAFTDPEIRRTNLASVILQMKALALGDIEDFPFLDRPDAAAIKDGYETLFELGAITTADRTGAATEIGARMSRIPADPRIARMLLAARDEDVVDEVVVLAAVLSIQDPRERPLARQQDADRAHAVFREGAGAGGETSDFLTLLNIWEQSRHAAGTMGSGAFVGWCREHFLSAARLREWEEMARQLGEVVEELGEESDAASHRARGTSHGTKSEDVGAGVETKRSKADRIHRALLTGLISNVACREGDGSFDYRGVRGNVVQIFPGSVLFKKGPKWIMAAEVVQTTRLYARTVARVDAEWIEALAGHVFRRQMSDPHLDVETGRPSGWERLTMAGSPPLVVVPRRRADLARVDPKAARAIFVREALAECKWKTDALFMVHNRGVLNAAGVAEAKLRRRNLLRSAEEIAAWFEARVPKEICEPEGFVRWRREQEGRDPRVLFLELKDVLKPEAGRALDSSLFPDEITLGGGNEEVLCAVEYALAPGKDEDGVTVTVPLRALPLMTPERAEWMVPGVLVDVVAGLIRMLPKPQRAMVEAKGEAGAVAAACAEAMSFGVGSLGNALSEALHVLYDVTIAPEAWAFKGLPGHLRLRVRVIDDDQAPHPHPPTAKPLGVDRDVAALHAKFKSRLEKLALAEERSGHDRRGITTWDFGDLPDLEAQPGPPHPALVDAGSSVTLTLLPDRDDAARRTHAGLRRLFALACTDEVVYYLESHPAWGAMVGQYAALGSENELRDQLTLVISERTFLDNQAGLRTLAAFEERRTAAWGRLSSIARETCDAVARVLEARAQIARRFSGGTPRLWAESVADIREQAAYLLPKGFLTAVGWERLRRYPVYAEVMRERLLNLREEGSRSEAGAMAAIAPQWKRFTGWVAGAMSAAAARQGADGGPVAEASEHEARGAPSKQGRGKAPLPQARRAAPKVNLDAGEWAMTPGHLTPAVERYRWAVEEFRVAMLAPERAGKPGMTAGELEKLWKAVGPPG